MTAHDRLTGWLETALPGLLPAFLPECRWFAGKGRRIQAADLEDAAWLPGAGQNAVVIADVRYADAARERYALLLAFVTERPDGPVVGLVDGHGPITWAVEAATDADAGLALLQGFASRRDIPTVRGGTFRYADSSDATARAVAHAATSRDIRPLGTEQSNASLRIDQTLVFKLFRRLDDGENPELEVGRFLATRTQFRAMPRVQGSLTYTSARGASSTVGVLQDWIQNRGDGWSYVVGQLRQPRSAAASEFLLRELGTLGAITADFHGALASDASAPSFAPEDITERDVRAWQRALLERGSNSVALVERNIHGWPEATRRLGQSLLGLMGSMILIRAPEFRPVSAKFRKIRVHGDYHLGQTLKTAAGFVLIDFEGEPARPLAERRQKQCVLKDVAGMIRSLDYAIAAAGHEQPDAGGDALSGPRLRESFLAGYFSAATTFGTALLPSDRGVIDSWIDFFELEKALYELEYEINTRPAWVHIPLRGILRILRGQTDEGGT